MTTMFSISGRTLDSSPSGIQCQFVRTGDTGLKVYSSREERDDAYRNQVWYYSKGLSVRPLFKCEINVEGYADGEDCTYYAYETEVAEVMDYDKRDEFNDRYGEDDGYDKWCDYRSRFSAAASEFAEVLQEQYGIDWFDNHGGNIGFDKDGNPVIIDTADNIIPRELLQA